MQAVEEFLMEDLERECLEMILTVPEVVRLYHKSHKTVIDLVDSGKLIGRKAHFGNQRLVSKRSCDERWPNYGRG